ncbi:MAG: phytoene dehydrogenase-like protein [Gammaproteobacteria bacterium]|jgi:phytoene dehydrogenase-like protein
MTYDVIIIGGGHNGLTSAAYLAKAGLRPLVLERRDIVGGAAVTEEFYPGFRNSTASYTVSLLNAKVIADLQLKDHGLRVVERAMSNFFPLSNDNYLSFPVDSAEKYKEFTRFSKHDADALGQYESDLEAVADELRALLLTHPPNPSGGIRDLLQLAKIGWKSRKRGEKFQRLILDMAGKSCSNFLDLYFESDVIKAAYAFDGIVGALNSPHDLGTSYVLLHHCFGEVNGKKGAWGHAIGGMGAISDAIASAARLAGAEIRTGVAVKEVIIEKGVACGVLLEDGSVIKARAVAANVSPTLLFGSMVKEEAVPKDFYRRIKHFKCGSGTFRMNVALSELPNFSCLPTNGMGVHHTGGIVISPDIEYMDRAYLDARMNGWSQSPIIEMLIPSTLDASLAPKGQHVASLFCQHFNYDLPDNQHWDDVREQVADHIIQTVNLYAPNFSSSIIARQIHSPLDLERKFGLPRGDIFHGQLSLDQLFMARPVLGHSDHRMPVKGLYLCGSGAHPGGGVTGVPGHNAAAVMIKDLTP